jgi:hypothetical protein
VSPLIPVAVSPASKVSTTFTWPTVGAVPVFVTVMTYFAPVCPR